jgi:hypothetical protein
MENLDENKVDRIEMVDLQVEMARSYLDYAMSVIVGRALPDIRDGLNQYTAEFYMQCMTLVIAQIRVITNHHASSVMSWVITIHMAMELSMTL